MATAEAELAKTREVLAAYELVGPTAPICDAGELGRHLDELRFADPACLLLQIGTFPDGQVGPTLTESLKVPVVVHSLREPRLEREVSLNSLCGANMTTFTLSALGYPHSSVHGDPREADVARRLKAHVNAALALADLRETRLDLIGSRAPGFYPCVFDEFLLRRFFGLAIEHIGLQAVTSRIERGDRRAAPNAEFPVIEEGSLPSEAVAEIERYYAALTGVIDEYGSSLVAIRDWPELWPEDVTGGIWPVLGWIQDEGIVVGVEGDVNGAVTLALEHCLTGDVPFLADVVAWDDKASTMTLWHYAGAPSLARDPAEIRYGADGQEVQFSLRPGRATLARLGLHQGSLRLLAITAEIEDREVRLRRAAGHARTLNTPSGDVVRHMLERGWEHHVCLAYGDVMEEFRAISRFTGIPLEEL